MQETKHGCQHAQCQLAKSGGQRCKGCLMMPSLAQSIRAIAKGCPHIDILMNLLIVSGQFCLIQWLLHTVGFSCNTMQDVIMLLRTKNKTILRNQQILPDCKRHVYFVISLFPIQRLLFLPWLLFFLKKTIYPFPRNINTPGSSCPPLPSSVPSFLLIFFTALDRIFSKRSIRQSSSSSASLFTC